MHKNTSAPYPVLGGDALVTVRLISEEDANRNTWIRALGKKILRVLLEVRMNRYFPGACLDEIPVVHLRSQKKNADLPGGHELSCTGNQHPGFSALLPSFSRALALGTVFLAALGIQQAATPGAAIGEIPARHEGAEAGRETAQARTMLPVISSGTDREVILQASVITPQPSKKHTFRRNFHMNSSITDIHTNVHTNLDFPPFSSHTDVDIPPWADTHTDSHSNAYTHTPYTDYSFDMDYIY